MNKYVKLLCKKSKRALCGTKSYNLSLMMKWNYNVPNGFCISTKAFCKFTNINNLSPLINSLKNNYNNKILLESCLEKVHDGIMKSVLPMDMITEIKDALVQLACEKVAIRSSALSEDSQNFSYAGLFDTFLDVPNELYSVILAIKKVWCSLFGLRVWKYNSEFESNESNNSMGVIIQEMLVPDRSGVAFSIHPITSDPEIIYIEETKSLGDKLVSGEITPVSYSCLKSNPDYKSEFVWIENLFKDIIELENRFAEPVDVEWAVKNDKLYFLQIRPITFGSLKKVTVWTDENTGEVLPGVVTPLTWDILGPLTNFSFKWESKKLGLTLNRRGKLFRLIGGKVYLNQTLFTKTLDSILPFDVIR